MLVNGILYSTVILVKAARLFSVIESMVQQECYTTELHPGWRSWEREEVISTTLKRVAMGSGHPIATQMVTADGCPLIASYDGWTGGFTILSLMTHGQAIQLVFSLSF